MAKKNSNQTSLFDVLALKPDIVIEPIKEVSIEVLTEVIEPEVEQASVQSIAVQHDMLMFFRETWTKGLDSWKKSLDSYPTEEQIAKHGELCKGWLLDYLFQSDEFVLGRWSWWERQLERDEIDYASPIPRIEFVRSGESTHAYKMLRSVIARISTGSEHKAIMFLMDWMMYGFALSAEPPSEYGLVEGAGAILYRNFNLTLLVMEPYDYFGLLLTEIGHGKGNAFYPTPMHVTDLMIELTYSGSMKPWSTAYDPCVGTGRTLLSSSNYSLHLYGQDIDGVMITATKLNMAMYAPWGVCRHPFEQENIQRMKDGDGSGACENGAA